MLNLLLKKYGPVMDIKAIAELFHNTDKVIYSMIYHKRLVLPCYKIGRKIFVNTEDVATYIDNQKVEACEWCGRNPCLCLD
jgi:hypothetical protein